MSKYEEKLKQMQESWNQSEETAEEMFSDIPEGVYVGVLQSAAVDESSNGNLMIKREHLITQGNFEGRVVYDNLMLKNETTIAFVRRWLNTMGFECPEDIAEIPEILEELVIYDDLLQFKVSRSDDFTNVNVLEVIEQGEPISEDTAENDTEETRLDPEPSKGYTDNLDSESEDPRENKKEGQSDSQAIAEAEIDDMYKKELKNLIKKRDLDVDLDLNKQPMKKAIKEELGIIQPETETETKTKTKKKKKKTKKKKKDSGKDWEKELEDFCIAQDLTELDDDPDIDGNVLDSIENMKEAVSFYEYEGDMLTKDEKAVLKHFDMEYLIS